MGIVFITLIRIWSLVDHFKKCTKRTADATHSSYFIKQAHKSAAGAHACLLAFRGLF